MILALVPTGKPRITVLIIVLRTAKNDPRRIERKHPMLFNSPQEGCYVLHGYSRIQILEPMAQSEFVFHGDWAGLRFLLGVKYTICVGTSSTETQVQVFSVSFLIFFFLWNVHVTSMLLQPSNLPSVKHYGMITLKSILLSPYPTDSLSEERSEKDTSKCCYIQHKTTSDFLIHNKATV